MEKLHGSFFFRGQQLNSKYYSVVPGTSNMRVVRIHAAVCNLVVGWQVWGAISACCLHVCVVRKK
jgi:hypothetical protein